MITSSGKAMADAAAEAAGEVLEPREPVGRPARWCMLYT
jgi:hypothetical protein